jgi:hypothetical protein
MKCQVCSKAARVHVTDIVAGNPVEYHVCDAHVHELKTVESAFNTNRPLKTFVTFMEDPQLRQALQDPVARAEMAAHVLPALCLALLRPQAKVRIVAAFYLMYLGSDARSAASALRDALRDVDERVRRAAQIALEHIETE